MDLITISVDLPPPERHCYEAEMGRFRPAFLRFRRLSPTSTWTDFVKNASRTQEGRHALDSWRRARKLLAFPRRKAEALVMLLRRHRNARVLVFTTDNETAYNIARTHLIMPITCDISRTEREEALQAWSDQRVDRWAEKALCPATGRTVRQSWEEERRWLRPVEYLPTPFDVVVTRPVYKDCMISFEGRFYPVPFRYVGERVEVRGCAETVEIWKDGRLLREHPRHTPERVLLDPSCYAGRATDRVLPPAPLGRMGRKLEEILQMPVAQRPLDLYAALMEVAR